MEARDTLQAELQIAVRDASILRNASTDLQTFKRILHRLDHALAAYCVGSEDKTGVCNDGMDIQSHNCDLYLEASTISGLISILTEVDLPLIFIKINISIEPLYYRILHTICDTIHKYIQDPIDSLDLDKVIDKVASLLLEEQDGGRCNSERGILLHKLLQIITSHLISYDAVSIKPSYSTGGDSLQDMDTTHLPLINLTSTETVELARILMQSSIRWMSQAACVLTDEYYNQKREETLESLMVTQLQIFLGFIFQHLLSFHVPLYDILQSQFTTTTTTTGRVVAVEAHEKKSRVDTLVQKYLELVDSYLKETIEHAANFNYHSLQSIHHETHKMNGGSPIHRDPILSIIHSCIRNTSLALGMIEIIHMTLRVTKPKVNDLIASLWISFGELVAFICPLDMIGHHSTVCDTADDLLFRLYQVVSDPAIHVSASFRTTHEKAIHGVGFTTLARLLSSLDTRHADVLDHEEWLHLLRNHFSASIYSNPDNHDPSSSSGLNEILFFSLHHLVTHEGQYAPHLLEKVIPLDPTNANAEVPKEESFVSADHLLLNPWYSMIQKKWTDRMISTSSQRNLPTTFVSTSSTVSDLSSFPKKRQRLGDDTETTPYEKILAPH